MIDRRGFLKLSSGAGAAPLVAACGWDGGNALRPKLLAISRINDWVSEKLLYSPSRLARTYSTAQRSRTLPSYFISPETPVLRDPGAWRLRMDGLVRQPLSFSLVALMRMPSVTYTVK